MQDTIKQYIRDEKGMPIGLMIGKAVGKDSYGIGYSIARPDSADKFDEHLGMTIATNRAGNMGVNSKIAYGNALGHTQFRDSLSAFTDRAGKFFQDRQPLADTEEKVVV
jgi:hypothetical protein